MLVGHHTDHNHDPFAIPKATTRRFRPQEIYFTASLLPLASDLPPAAPACHQRGSYRSSDALISTLTGNRPIARRRHHRSGKVAA
jgi:hypothetical protein